MNYALFKANDKIAELGITVYLSGVVVNRVKILKENKLPYEIKECLKFGLSIELAIERWMKLRTIPADRENLDNMLYDYFSVEQYNFGRMTLYKDIPAIFSYYRSGFDDYSVIPNTKEYYLFSEENQFINRLYEITSTAPVGFDRKTDDRTKCLIKSTGIDNESSSIQWNASSSYTIPSKYRSWWDDGKLVQIVPQKEADEIQNGLKRLQVKSKYRNGELIIYDIPEENMHLVRDGDYKYNKYAGQNYAGDISPILCLDDNDELKAMIA